MRLLEDPLARLRAVFGDVVDPWVGIVGRLEEVRLEPGSPAFFHYAARACNTGAFIRQVNFKSTGGASVSRDIAMAKAIGEAIERYSAAIYDVDELPLASFDDAPFRCVAPGEFALYGEAQYDADGFPWTRFESSTRVRWAPAVDALANEVWHVPAAMVYIPYAFYRGTGDAPIVQPISTGLACHVGPTRAALSAVCEVIERDAFTITWQSRMSPPQIRVETLSDANYDCVQRFERAGGAVVMLDLTLDHGVPTILSVLRQSSLDAPALVFAAATDLDPEVAARKSLEELAHTRRYSQQIKTYLPPLADDPAFDNVADQISHLGYYADHRHRDHADFITASRVRRDFDEIENLSTGDIEGDLRCILERLRGIGHRTLIADVTTPDVEELGFSVVRAVIPGFHPLFMGHKLRACGGKRLWEVPQHLGYPGVRRENGDNPFPHPYP